MQYDENAEKYGYEGEMTPMKCNELKPCTYDDMIDGDADINIEYYPKSEVDAVLAEKDKEIAMLKERICNGDVSRATWIDDCFDKDKEIEELKQKLESVQASMYCDVVDANMEVRRLRRALWIARAEWARSSALSYHLIESHPNKDVAETYKRKANKWEKVKDKCLKKAEEYK